MNDHGQPTLRLDPLIEAATRNLRDNPEHRIAAAGFLETLRQPGDEVAAQAIARWDEIDSRKPGRTWARAAVMACVLLVLGILCVDFGAILRTREWNWSGLLSDLELSSEKRTRNALVRLHSRLPEEHQFPLFGTAAPVDVVNGRKTAWEHDPQNPALFSLYAVCHLHATGSLPEGFLETAGRIDPDNAWFAYLAAAAESREAVRLEAKSFRFVRGKRVANPASWTVLAPDRYQRTLEILRKAKGLRRFDSYQSRNMEMLLWRLPQRTREEHGDSMVYCGIVVQIGKFGFRGLVDVISASAWMAGRDGDRPAYDLMIDAGEALLCLLLTEEPTTASNEILNYSVATGLANGFAEAASAGGWPEEVTRWQFLLKRCRMHLNACHNNEFHVDGQAADPIRVTGYLNGFGAQVRTLNQFSRPMAHTDGELRPGRLMEHEMMSWLLSWVCFLVMGLWLVVFVFYQYRIAPLVRMVAERFEALLHPGDWVRIFACGVMLPFILVMGVNRFTPLGGRDFGFAGTWMMLPTLHFAGLVIAWLAAPWLLIRTCLAKRVRVFGFGHPHWVLWLGWISITAFVPVIGFSVLDGGPAEFWRKWTDTPPGDSPQLFWVAAALMIFSVSILLIAAATALIGSNNGMLRQALVARVMARVCAVAMLVCAVASLGFKWAEHHWFAVDTMLKIDPSVPSWTRYEYQCALRMREELRDLLETGQ